MPKNILSPLKSDLVTKRKVSSINAYIWNLGKWYWWTYLQGRNTDTEAENGLVDTAEKGEGGTNWENSIDINALPCVKQIASEKLLNSTRSSAQFSEGWDGDGVGRSLKRAEIHVYLRLIHIVVRQKPMQHCKGIIHQLKIIFKKKFERRKIKIKLDLI